MAGPERRMIGVTEGFSQSYAQARQQFLHQAQDAGAVTESFALVQRGIDGEELAVDIALDGPMDAEHLLIVSSGCHGVEGYCGSGIQVFALADEEWRTRARQRGVSVLYIHALNPYGFSYGSRNTQENIDLNRNFIDWSQPVPVNAAYAELHPILVPGSWPPDAANNAAIGQYLQTRGERALQAAVSGGQYQFPDGMFYGGTAPSWSHATLLSILQRYACKAQRLAWIDLHTGLGQPAFGERILGSRSDAAARARATAWWSGNGQTPVVTLDSGQSVSTVVSGEIFSCLPIVCPQAEATCMCIEFGTLPLLQVFSALRADQWLRRQSALPASAAQQTRRLVRDAFYTDEDGWKGPVLSQARQAMFQAADGLATPH